MAIVMPHERNQGIALFLLSSILTFVAVYVFLRINRTRVVPLNWPLIGMLPGLAANIERPFDYVTNILRESANIFEFRGPWLLGMDFVLTCDPENANHVFSTHSDNYPKGQDLVGPSASSATASSIAAMNCGGFRRMAHTRLSNPKFRSSVASITRDKAVNGILPLLSEMAESDNVFDLQEACKRFAFDITCSLVLGIDPRSLSSGFPETPFLTAVDDIEHVLFLRHTVPMFWWKLQSFLGVGKENRMMMAWRAIDEFIAQCIAEKREDQQQKRQRINCDEDAASSDLLSLYFDTLGDEVNHLESQDKDYFHSDRFLRDSLLTFLVAGKDSTGNALSWFLYALSMNPYVEKKIVQELSQVRSTAAPGKMVVFDSEEIEGLVYLHAALCETLRLFPPVPMNSRCSLKCDMLQSGRKVPPGTTVIYFTFSTARMEKVWGEDCMEFKPERWITADGKVKNEPSYKFLAFGCGPRTCPGKSVAFTEMKIAAAAIVYNFHVEGARGHKVEPMISVTLSMKNGFMAKLKKRENNGQKNEESSS